MKSKSILLFFLVLLAGACSEPSYLEIAENEIDIAIEKGLVCENDYFYNELEAYFENFLKSNGLVAWNEGIEYGYYNYLTSVQSMGGGFGTAKGNKDFIKLTEKVTCSGHILGKENYLGLIHTWVEPTITKYKAELIKENKEKDILFAIGTCDPFEEYISIGLMLEGMLDKYKPTDFKRPVLKKYVILFWFLGFE